MTSLAEKAAAAKASLSPANNRAPDAPEAAAERKRIPMSLPMLKLEVPEIPGYHLHWIRGTQDRVQQAQNAGYEFVDQAEVATQLVSIGGDATKSGNTDMGTRVSTLASPYGEGEVDGTGQPLRLFLMKQKEEYYKEDQLILQRRNDSVADTLTAAFRDGTPISRAEGETGDDVGQRYVGNRTSKVPDLFKRKNRRA